MRIIITEDKRERLIDNFLSEEYGGLIRYEPKNRPDLIFFVKDTKKEPINCIHPSAIISTKKIGNGNLICPNSVIHVDAYIGDCTIINTGSIVEHDCYVDSFSQISPNVTLCGYVKIGESSFISASSTIIPNIKIGHNSTVAAGSVVIEDVPSNVMVAGVPSKIKKYYKL